MDPSERPSRPPGPAKTEPRPAAPGPSQSGEGWPRAVFDAPVLRGLDARSYREIAEAGRLFSRAPGEAIYRAGDPGASFFVVASGRISLRAVRRGDEEETELRTAGIGESFGEEATVELGRRATAIAVERATVAEIPVALFRRAAARSGKAMVAERLERGLRHRATRDLLGTLAFTRDLPPRDVDVLLDAVTHHRFERGQAIYRQGDRSDEFFLIADGMVQIQIEDQDRLHVRAYLNRGDFFGDVELTEGGVAGAVRTASAVASGPVLVLAVPGRIFLSLSAAHPDLLPSLRRIAEDQQAAQQALVGKAAKNATAHVFRDLYRLKVARSLLVIDLESCVRCGHCAWSCSEMYGTARLTRRGDKMVARVDTFPVDLGDDGPLAPQHLMLPNSCQHCENPACMAPCPTGAIGRDPAGEVFIREPLCTGCGACAKACPWDNIQMAVRPISIPLPSSATPSTASAPFSSAQIAVKCDLCRNYEGPACVQACPTDSIFRINPAEEIADVREILRGASPEAGRRARERGPWLLAGAALAAVGIGLSGAVMQARERWGPGRGVGFWAGIAAAVTMLLLLGYAIPKRRIRLWMRPRPAEGARPRKNQAVTSVIRPMLAAHLSLGVLALGFALAHAPWPPTARASHGSALAALLLLTSIAGGLTALAYRLIPPRLARIERAAALPEDFEKARRELIDRLYRDVSGKSDLVKKIFERILLPYTQRRAGPALLFAGGRSLREEADALGERIDKLLEGRGKERLAGLAELIRIVVELRALTAQRWLLTALRVGLPVHVVTFGLATALLLLHGVIAVLR